MASGAQLRNRWPAMLAIVLPLLLAFIGLVILNRAGFHKRHAWVAALGFTTLSALGPFAGPIVSSRLPFVWILVLGGLVIVSALALVRWTRLGNAPWGWHAAATIGWCTIGLFCAANAALGVT